MLHCFIKHHALLLIYPSITCSTAPSSHHVLPHIHLGAICSKLSTEAPCASPCPSRHHVLHLFHPRTTCSTSSIQVPHASLLHQNPMCSTSSIQVPCAPLIHQDPMCSTSSIQAPPRAPPHLFRHHMLRCSIEAPRDTVPKGHSPTSASDTWVEEAHNLPTKARHSPAQQTGAQQVDLLVLCEPVHADRSSSATCISSVV